MAGGRQTPLMPRGRREMPFCLPPPSGGRGRLGAGPQLVSRGKQWHGLNLPKPRVTSGAAATSAHFGAHWIQADHQPRTVVHHVAMQGNDSAALEMEGEVAVA